MFYVVATRLGKQIAFQWFHTLDGTPIGELERKHPYAVAVIPEDPLRRSDVSYTPAINPTACKGFSVPHNPRIFTVASRKKTRPVPEATDPDELDDVLREMQARVEPLRLKIQSGDWPAVIAAYREVWELSMAVSGWTGAMIDMVTAYQGLQQLQQPAPVPQENQP